MVFDLVAIGVILLIVSVVLFIGSIITTEDKSYWIPPEEGTSDLYENRKNHPSMTNITEEKK